uniref:Uncharacterized protein n=1 Tax=Anguilla anguilla TaxID=7936 RepID=A0A0E9VQZ9_ANGAN
MFNSQCPLQNKDNLNTLGALVENKGSLLFAVAGDSSSEGEASFMVLLKDLP